MKDKKDASPWIATLTWWRCLSVWAFTHGGIAHRGDMGPPSYELTTCGRGRKAHGQCVLGRSRRPSDPRLQKLDARLKAAWGV